MKLLLHILIGFISFLFVACGPSNADRGLLDRAEFLVREHSDSALAILDSLSPTALSHPDFRARATVVNAEAAYQKFAHMESDSMLNEAVAYYQAQPNSPRRLRAFYLRAYQHKLAGRYTNAIIDYLTAEPIARHLADSLSLGLIYRGLGDVYTQTYDFKPACEAYKTAHIYLRNSPKYNLWAKYDIAKGYYLMDLSDSCQACLDSVISLAATANDTTLIGMAKNLKAKSLINIRKYAEAISCYEWVIRNLPKLLDENDYLYLGSSYMLTGNKDMAQECGNKIRELTGEDYTWIDFYGDGKSDRAHSFIVNEYNDQNEHLTNLAQQDLHQVIHDSLKLQSLAATQQADSLRRQRMVLLVLALAIICIVLLLFRIRAKGLRQRLAEHIAVAHELNERLQSQSSLLHFKSAENDALRHDVRTTFVTQLDFLKNFAENYFECQGNKNAQAKMAKQLMEMINSFRPESPNFTRYEEAIDARFDKLITRVRTDVPALHPGEIALYVYYVLQFSPRCISLFMDCTVTAVYNRKKILKSKITLSGSHSTAEFLSFLA